MPGVRSGVHDLVTAMSPAQGHDRMEILRALPSATTNARQCKCGELGKAEFARTEDALIGWLDQMN
jgi:hypothetical protein